MNSDDSVEYIRESRFSKDLEGTFFDDCIVLYIEEFKSRWVRRSERMHNWFHVLTPEGRIDKKYVTLDFTAYKDSINVRMEM